MGHNSKEKIESEYAHQYTMYFLAKFHEILMSVVRKPISIMFQSCRSFLTKVLTYELMVHVDETSRPFPNSVGCDKSAVIFCLQV